MRERSPRSMETVENWRTTLAPVIERSATWNRLLVLDAVGSTQDAARQSGAGPGLVVTTLRQSAGRGRLGRAWADTAASGAAVTMVVETAPAERLAIAGAVGVARAIERFVGEEADVGVKWPNDVLWRRRKVSGVLIEGDGRIALVGVGVNVNQGEWPQELAGMAVSLAQIRGEMAKSGDSAPAGPARIDVVRAVLEEVEEALGMGDSELTDAFRQRDLLKGTQARFREGDHVVEGTVEVVDPMEGLAIRDQSSGVVHWLRAATATMESWSPA